MVEIETQWRCLLASRTPVALSLVRQDPPAALTSLRVLRAFSETTFDGTRIRDILKTHSREVLLPVTVCAEDSTTLHLLADSSS